MVNMSICMTRFNIRNSKLCHRLHVCFRRVLRRQRYFLRTALNYLFLQPKRSFSTARSDGQFKHVSGSFYSLNSDKRESRRYIIPISCSLISYNIKTLNQSLVTSARNVALNKLFKWSFIVFSRLYNFMNIRSDVLSVLVITGLVGSRRHLYGFHRSLFAHIVALLAGNHAFKALKPQDDGGKTLTHAAEEL